MPLYDAKPMRPRECDRVADELRRMILRLELPPGAVISEAYLTEKLQCGRTPLREAFQRLAAEYLVVCVPMHGVSVASLSILDFAHYIQVLILLEGPAVRQATPRISETDIRALAEIVAEGERANRDGDLAAVAEFDVQFHGVIVQASGNPYLADGITRLHRLCTRFGHIAWQRKASAEPSLAEHQEILAALKDRDAAAAERLACTHTEMARERIRAAM